MTRVVQVAALQFPAEPGAVTSNRDRFVRMVRGLDDPVDLIVAPELAITGYDLTLIDKRGPELAEPLDGESVTTARDLAADRDATIVLGLLERAPEGLYDTAVIVTPSGAVTGYRKSHLYPPETARLRAGDELRPVRTPVAALGPLICFEHAFPAIATTLALAGAEILVIPSAVPVGYEYLLELRSRARAQDNQVFVVASNLTGHGFCGRSLIADPRGDVLASAGERPAVLRARLELSEIAAERSREPALRMHRPELYGPAAGGNARTGPVDDG